MIILSELLQAIGIVSVPISTILILRYTEKRLKNTFKAEIRNFLGSEEGQKQLYSVGVLIGNGAKTGFGLKGSGKFKFEDLLMKGAGKLFELMEQRKNTNQTPNSPPATKQGNLLKPMGK